MSELTNFLSSLSLDDDNYECSESQLNELQSQFNQYRNQLLSTEFTSIVEAIAQLARNASNRNALGEREIPLIITQLLNESNVDSISSNSVSASICALANLIFNHECNQQQVERIWSASILIQWLDRYQSHVSVLINAGLLLANLAHDEDFREALMQSGASEMIHRYLHHSHDDVISMAARAITSLSQSKEHQRLLAKAGVMQDLTDIACNRTQSERLRLQSFEALMLLMNGNVDNCVEYSRGSSIKQLLEFARNAENSSGVQHVFDLLIVLVTVNEDVRLQFGKQNLLSGLLEDATSTSSTSSTTTEENQTTIKHGSLRLIGHLCVDDAAMQFYWSSYPYFMTLLDSSEENIRLYATMIISNLARTESNCACLMQHGVVNLLMPRLREDNFQFQHLAASAIRNLAIPQTHKEQIVRECPETLAALVGLLTSTNPHVLWASVYAIKVICAAGAVAIDVFLNAGGLDAVLSLFERELPEECAKILFEAARLISNICMVNATYRNLIVEHRTGLKPITMLVKSSFAILQVEGFRVVIELFKVPESRVHLANSELLLGVVHLVASGDRELRSTSMRFLVDIVRSDEQAKLALASTNAKELLSPMVNSTNAETATAARLLVHFLNTDGEQSSSSENNKSVGK